MFNPSNLYAEKIYAEHPLELWALDDAADYVSLIKESQRDLAIWDVSVLAIDGSTTVDTLFGVYNVTSSFSENTQPIKDTNISKISMTPNAVFDTAKITLTSNTTFVASDDFAIGLSILSNPYTTKVRVGYQIATETPTWSQSLPVVGTLWTPVLSELLAPPASAAKILIEISLVGASIVQTYDFYINGLSLGIMSQEFSGTSLGFDAQDKPVGLADLLAGTAKVLPAKSYSFSEKDGYYTIDGDKSRARNSTVPMVFGALNSTILSKADNENPSLVIPGMGFLNDTGKKFTRTLECWLRINSVATAPRRIIGPIKRPSSDGLYVHGPFLLLKIGSKIKSHYVGEWARPMLIQISMYDNNVDLLVNSETVFSMSVDFSTINFPDANEDWIGFYAYDDIESLEVDCIAIYPYAVPNKVAKKRYIYGQGVVLPESTNTSYGGSSVMVDYSFANYDKNFSFPKDTQWKYGIVDNLYADPHRLSAPTYSPPTLYLGNRTKDAWLTDLQTVQDDTSLTVLKHRAFIKMRPSSSFSDVFPYFLFENVNVLYGSRTQGIYATIELDTLNASDQTVLKIEEITSNRNLEVIANANSIRYVLNNSATPMYTVSGLTGRVAIGLDFDTIRDFSNDAALLFSDTSNLRVTVGGSQESSYDKDLTFTGKIYEFGMLSPSDADRLTNAFFDAESLKNGISKPTTAALFELEYPAYATIVTNMLGVCNLDVAMSGYWEDNVPLSVFKRMINNSDGTTSDSLSILQINVDYPEMNIFSNGVYDTSAAVSKFYVSFQHKLDGSKITPGRTDIAMRSSGSVNISSNWKTERYEVVDGAIISVPDFKDYDLTIDDILLITTIETEIDGIELNPIAIRSFDISSISFADNELRGIGTKYGTKVYPFEKVSGVPVSTKNNQFKIYKSSTPYLYLTSKTGLQLVGDIYQEGNVGYINKGLSIKINENLAPVYSVSSMMMFMKNNQSTFSANKTLMFEITANDLENAPIVLRFFYEPSNSKRTRARISCERKVDNGPFTKYNGITYYWNGNTVAYPEMSTNEWGVLSISFQEFLSLSKIVGTLNVTSNIMLDNVSIYKISETTASSSTTINTWNTAKYGSVKWENVMDTDGFANPTVSTADDNSWFDTYAVVESSLKPVDQTDIYRTYLGTNKVIVDTTDSTTFKALRATNCEYVIYNATEWKTNTLNPI